MISNKAQFSRLWQAGSLGNKFRSWIGAEELEQSDYSGPVTVRILESDSKLCKYNVPYQEALQYRGKQFLINESAPDSHLTMQGEIVECPDLQLHYSLLPDKMRIALSLEPRYALGLRARLILKYFMNSGSYEEMFELLDRYPCHAVEFSCYTMNVGNIPHRNTVIWEVRNY